MLGNSSHIFNTEKMARIKNQIASLKDGSQKTHVNRSSSLASILRKRTDEKLQIKDNDFGNADSFAAKKARQDSKIVQERHYKNKNIVVVQATGGGTRSATVLSKDRLDRINNKIKNDGLFTADKALKGRRRRGINKLKYSKVISKKQSNIELDEDEETEEELNKKREKLKQASLSYFLDDAAYYQSGNKISNRTKELNSKILLR